MASLVPISPVPHGEFLGALLLLEQVDLGAQVGDLLPTRAHLLLQHSQLEVNLVARGGLAALGAQGASVAR